MKLLICSDIHGDLKAAETVINKFNEIKADKLLLLGDILYHGPRNDLPSGYNPKEVIKLLNRYKDKILAVRGNCDTEVDQMVLEFPILADYALLSLDGLTVYATHGHIYNTEKMSPMSEGDILLHGHTHLLGVTPFGNKNICINPGSPSIPKGGNPASYMVYEDMKFTIYDFDGNELESKFF